MLWVCKTVGNQSRVVRDCLRFALLSEVVTLRAFLSATLCQETSGFIKDIQNTSIIAADYEETNVNRKSNDESFTLRFPFKHLFPTN